MTRRYVDLAREGDLDALVALADHQAASKQDRLAYQWLCAARDFGHEEADELIGDVLEVTSLRYDDSGLEVAAAHWELGVGYLTGDQGLPVDLRLAQEHLEQAFERGDLEVINAGTGETYAAAPVLARLGGEARRVLEVELAGGDPRRRVERLLARVERLLECQAPEVIVEAERDLLRAAAATLFDGLPGDGDTGLEGLRQSVRQALAAG